MEASTQSAAVWLLCMLSACSLAVSGAVAGRMLTWVLVLLAGELVMASALLLQWQPAGSEAAMVAGCACAWQLLRPGNATFAALAAGVCAALAILVQGQQGAPMPAAILLGLLVVGATLRFTGAERFAPVRMQEQALTGLVLAAPILAALPGVLSGWQSAVTINLAVEARGLRSVPAWVWEFGIAMIMLGSVRALWVRR